jgi:tetratricopeptide (TPR) repeat protein
VSTLVSLADYQVTRENYALAEEYLRRALATAPDDPNLRYYHGRALYYQKRYRESEADLVRALEDAGPEKMPLTLYYLGHIQKEKKNHTGAAEFFRLYLEWAYREGRLTAVEADVHLALAEIYGVMNLPDLAEQQRVAGETLRRRLEAVGEARVQALSEYLKRP